MIITEETLNIIQKPILNTSELIKVTGLDRRKIQKMIIAIKDKHNKFYASKEGRFISSTEILTLHLFEYDILDKEDYLKLLIKK